MRGRRGGGRLRRKLESFRAGLGAMARRAGRQRRAAGGGSAALPSLPSFEDEADEAPEEVSFDVARAAAETERKIAGEAARRHRELLKEKRRRREELFKEQKRKKLLPEAVLQELAAAPPGRQSEVTHAADQDEHPEDGPARQSEGHVPGQLKKDKPKGTRSKGNYMAVHLKDQSLTGLHQQTAKDFLYTHLYGAGTNRTHANEFFSLENKKNPVKKAAVQFVDKSWGLEEKQKAMKFKKCWLAAKMKSLV
ncbi:U3 small nucleolar RNA-associated protein NOL7 [Apteryx mantelli]|uniref:U3 small nucleolar RNA-associated protein NOL7 n=1 Tax=Apteryx mantelli TaxID=2696672 RepID=A0ABM4E2P8_9AVES|nr:nucleolar protein 7 [Apteryx rowi]XP_025915337.1 nucleolar protein 7 [Apteryx rowi]